MKHKLFILMLILMLAFISACGSETNSTDTGLDDTHTADEADNSETVTYESENGPIDVPANPQRIVALTNAPNVLALDGAIVGVDQWTNMNPLFTEKLTDIAVVSESDLETVISQKPDLIIAGSTTENLDQLEKIAPTVVYTWGKLDYLEQQLEIGKLLNKEEEAQQWIDDFSERATELGEAVKAKAGEDVTVSVLETNGKDFSVFGDDWARGTEILYQAMGLGMPELVKENALGEGYYMLSQEVIPEYVGDYIVLSRNQGEDNAFMETEMWNSIPAVQNGHVIEIETKAVTYSDPITLEYLLDIFAEGFLDGE
ncbi:iron-hydroxamate ABC transporter substrate-binding protein [Halalkalibacter oceani]|uniref:iron-hydroxamate ABC transporter substrate-binding protein n=1 Tax=Halalkalibacter oceani TaxID=1653776 RepID=UPI003394623C